MLARLLIAALAFSFSASAIAQQSMSGPKGRPGATVNSMKGAIPPSVYALGGRMMLKPGQNFVGGKVTAAPTASVGGQAR